MRRYLRSANENKAIKAAKTAGGMSFRRHPACTVESLAQPLVIKFTGSHDSARVHLGSRFPTAVVACWFPKNTSQVSLMRHEMLYSQSLQWCKFYIGNKQSNTE